MKKILITLFFTVSMGITFGAEVTPIYEYRPEVLKKIEEKMEKERDRERLKKLNEEYQVQLLNYIESVGGDSNIIFQLGDQYFRMNYYERAREIFSMDKKDIRNLFGAATTARFLGKNEEAVSGYNAILEIKPDFYEAYLGRGLANRNMKNYDNALNDFKQYLNYHQDEYVYVGMGDIYMVQERYQEAKNILERGQGIYPNSKVIRDLLIKVYSKL